MTGDLHGRECATLTRPFLLFCTRRLKKLHEILVTILGCQHQRGRAVTGLGIYIRLACNQRVRDAHMSNLRRQH